MNHHWNNVCLSFATFALVAGCQSDRGDVDQDGLFISPPPAADTTQLPPAQIDEGRRPTVMRLMNRTPRVTEQAARMLPFFGNSISFTPTFFHMMKRS